MLDLNYYFVGMLVFSPYGFIKNIRLFNLHNLRVPYWDANNQTWGL
jgi:hypothetical protein